LLDTAIDALTGVAAHGEVVLQHIQHDFELAEDEHLPGSNIMGWAPGRQLLTRIDTVGTHTPLPSNIPTATGSIKP
jgi:hypothetical protein